MENNTLSETTNVASVCNSNNRLKNHFRSAICKTVEKYLSSFSFKLFRKYFAEIYADSPADLLDKHECLISQLKTCILLDIKDLSKEMKVPSSLCMLDALIKKLMVKEGSWRPTEEPETDLRDHIYKLKLQHKEMLLKTLKNLETERKDLQIIVNDNHREILNIKKETDYKNENLQNHLHVMSLSTSDDLKAMLQATHSSNITEPL